MKRMHVLIIPSEAYVPVGFSLFGIFQRDQAQGLHRAGCHVGVITVDLTARQLFSRKDDNKHGFRLENQGKIPCFRFRSWNWFSFFGDAATCAWIQAGMALFKRYCKDIGTPALVHAHNGILVGQLARQIKKKYGIPYVITEHSSDFARGKLRKKTLKKIGKAYAEASLLIAVSESLGGLLESIYGVDLQPWVWIPNLLSPSFQESAPIPVSSREKSKFCFLNIGSLEEVKGQTFLIRAFAQAFGGKKDVRLRIGGDGTLRNKLEKLAEDLGVADQVTLLGSLDRQGVLQEMAQGDAFVFSSTYETFGVALIEALACGMPVVATACGGPESIVNKTNGLLVPVGDTDALGQAMVSLSRDIGKYDRAKIQQNCIATFGEKAVTSQLIAAYEGVIKE